MDDATTMIDTGQELRLLVAAGGTGGHIFPALAVVEQLRSWLGEKFTVEFIGSKDRMESHLIPSMGYPYTPMPIEGFKGLMSPDTLFLPFKVLRSERIARDVIARFKPHAVLATGAYMSYPAGMAAHKEDVPLVIMESNANPGKTNTRLAHAATTIIVAFEESRDAFTESVRDRIVVGGNPVRGQITADHPQTSAREAFGLDALRPTVLVFGGSLGARSLNEAMQQAVDRWVQTKTAPDFQILWQTGDHFSANVSDALKDRLRVVQFIDDMGMAYAAADVVVARSGATTIAELGIVGKPAILIPLPSASTNEQRYNADIVARHGAAIIIDDADVRTTMVDTMQALMIDPGRRESMSGAMRSLGRPDAASIAAGLVLKAASRTTEGVA